MAISSILNGDAQKTEGSDQNQSVGIAWIAWQLRPAAIRRGCMLKREEALKLQRPCNDPLLCGAKRRGGRFACVVFNQQFSACTPFMHYGWGTCWTTSSAFVLPDAPVTSQEKPSVLWLHRAVGNRRCSYVRLHWLNTNRSMNLSFKLACYYF